METISNWYLTFDQDYGQKIEAYKVNLKMKKSMYGIDNNYNPKQKYEKTNYEDLSLIIWHEWP